MVYPSAWPAPAKLNLMLRIVGRRADGYHELQTVYQFLDRQDHLTILPRPDTKVIHNNPLVGIDPEDDLSVRAARLLQHATSSRQGAEIHIDKRLPMGGGLGGGSSDAATTLVALNQLWSTGLSIAKLARIGLTLGADVPIFVHGHAAWAEGIGETFSELDLPEPWYLVLTPDCHVSTAEIFAAADLTRDSARIRIRDFLQGDRANDCLLVVRQRYPAVAAALDWLQQHAPAQMTGTGACVFAAFDDEAAARAVHEQMPDGFIGFVAKGLNRSPLLDCMQQR